MIAVKTVMTTDVKYVTPDTPIYEALDILQKFHISGLPVVNGNMEVVGLLSQKDVLEILIDKNLDVKNKVGDYMTREVICFEENDNVVDICKFFIKSNIRRVPIVRNGKLIGIVSRRDIVTVILEARSRLSNFRYD
ncbi:MAG TPA: CBS domain-containing protein [Candidatus Omnitrophota bacterium]|nr:CBS domain-containing protein [Candidatus Omnitrophota bacterium]